MATVSKHASWRHWFEHFLEAATRALSAGYGLPRDCVAEATCFADRVVKALDDHEAFAPTRAPGVNLGQVAYEAWFSSITSSGGASAQWRELSDDARAAWEAGAAAARAA